jgi:uncharacterized membrane protein
MRVDDQRGVLGMLRRVLAVLCVACMASLLGTVASAAAARPAASASAAPAAIVGLYLTTEYPALTVRAGEPTTVDLTLHNFRLPPQLLAVSVPQAAQGWKATILGGGQPIGSAIVNPNSEDRLQLRLVPPKGAGPGDYHFLVAARGAGGALDLPISLTIGRELPARLDLSTDFPALRGTSSTAFSYTVKVANDSGHNATINFTADAPKSFQATFTEAYGSQQITSIPIAAGKSKEIDMSVSMPHDTPAGDYKLAMNAKSEAASAALPLGITIFGQPRLSLTGEGGRLSGQAYAGKASPLTVVVRNNGSEAARDVTLNAAAPDGWKTSVDPTALPELGAGKSQSVEVVFTPSVQAIAGDYQTTVSASTKGGQARSADFRITVLTSTLWGMVGIGVIAAALLVVVFAVARYGRR